MDSRLVILSRAPSCYSTRRLAEEAEKMGWAVRIIDPLSVTVVVDERGGRIFHRGWPVECEAVIPRIGYSITRRGVAIVRQFEHMGVIILNPSDAILQSRDKLLASQLMADAGIPVPITAHVAAREDTNRAIERVGGVPCEPKSSNGIARPRPWNVAHKRLTITRAVSGLSRAIIQFAKFIREARPSEALPNLRYSGTAGCTISPVSSSQLPRGNTRTMRGLAMETETSEVGLALMAAVFSAFLPEIFWRRVASSGARVR